MKAVRMASIFMLLTLASMLAYGYFSIPAGGVKGVYNNEPRLADGHVDTTALISAIKSSGANTYNYLIGHAATDWEDLPAFLEAAGREGIDVWVTLLPPSESPPYSASYSEPHRLDFLAWAKAIAGLSLSHKNLKAWAVDNLDHDCGFFTEEYLGHVVQASRGINPGLKFIPVVYYPALGMPQCSHIFALADGLQFYYRHESGRPDVSSTDTLAAEIRAFRARFRKPLILGFYASCVTKNACPAADYVRKVLEGSSGKVDGWMAYTLQTDKESFAPVVEFYRRLRG